MLHHGDKNAPEASANAMNDDCGGRGWGGLGAAVMDFRPGRSLPRRLITPFCKMSERRCQIAIALCGADGDVFKSIGPAEKKTGKN